MNICFFLFTLYTWYMSKLSKATQFRSTMYLQTFSKPYNMQKCLQWFIYLIKLHKTTLLVIACQQCLHVSIYNYLFYLNILVLKVNLKNMH